MQFRSPLLLAAAAMLILLPAAALRAQEPPAPDAPPPSEHRQRMQAMDEGGPLPLFGKITSMQANSIHITDINGADVTIKFTPQTEFRKDRQPVALKNFKVGDGVLVRGEENPDHSFTAKIIVGRGADGGPNGVRGGPGDHTFGGGSGDHRFGGGPMGTLGKDFVVGEVQSIDAPSITVLRTDKVKQTIELNEETSLRKGPDSVTMADIHVGDHLFARGALQENLFVPKSVVVISPEQWKRVQEMGGATPNAEHKNSGDGQAKPLAGPPN